MSSLEDVLVYICKKYPIPDELSKARLTKLVYLADWMACQKLGRQITNVKWYFHNFGPYVDDVIEAARGSEALEVISSANLYGEPKEIIKYKKCFFSSGRLPHGEIEILDSIISETKKFYWKDFIKHVYETYPIASSDRYSYLDLVKLAKQARA